MEAVSDTLHSATGLARAVGRARSAARAGDLDEASRLLDEAGAAGSDSVGVLDVLARVHAQRGDLAEADRCWARVLVLEPDDADAAEGRRIIDAVVAGRRRARPLVTTGRAVVAAVVVVVAALVTGIALLGTGVGDRPSMTVADQARLQEETGRANALQARLTSLDVERRAAAEARARDLDAIVATLSMPGVIVQRRADDVQVVFEEGLFTRDTEISREGAALLVTIGRRLAGADVRTTVVGHTVAVPGGRTAGGSVVALARAQVAVDYLSRGGLPVTAFTLVSAEQAQGPFPDAPRNRTVTLQVDPGTSRVPG